MYHISIVRSFTKKFHVYKQIITSSWQLQNVFMWHCDKWRIGNVLESLACFPNPPPPCLQDHDCFGYILYICVNIHLLLIFIHLDSTLSFLGNLTEPLSSIIEDYFMYLDSYNTIRNIRVMKRTTCYSS